MAGPAAQTVTSPWAAHRRRGEALRDQHRHAGQVLGLYLALLDAWDEAWELTRTTFGQRAPSAPAGLGGAENFMLAGWAAVQVAPRVMATTVQSGPAPLADAVSELAEVGAIEPLLSNWLAGAELPPVERYLARAVLRGPLEAFGAAAACAPDPAPRGGRHCPTCGGLPQLSYRSDAGDALVSGRRQLLCARCGGSWPYASNSCAGCGETAGAKRIVFAEHRDGPVVGRPAAGADAGANAGPPPLFPHLRIEACESCTRYLIDVDLGLDGRAVPEVDELAALPLDLYAAERGLRKIAPNLMGF